MGKRIHDMRIKGKLIDPNKKYKVAGWAPVAEEAKNQNLKPVWEVAEQWLKASGGRVKARKLNTPKLEGVLPNPGFAA
jgi:sulfur-oxidizing protein SoxB